MFKIDFSLFTSFYIFLFLLIFTFLWLVSFLRQKKNSAAKVNSVSSCEKYIECNVCTYIYEVNSKENLLICPRCQSFNGGKR